ncbi:MAG TPA: enoyl-CoA hydratase-related protein, partial [Candidatus Binataceae bacterium]|nr:enoyl-CoA hydratase-related protein [Candidatus Binataceae bacterium]
MKHFSVETEGHVQTWTMSNPPMNYMTAAMTQEMLELIGHVEGDENVRAIILTGGIEGKFITHYSVEE